MQRPSRHHDARVFAPDPVVTSLIPQIAVRDEPNWRRKLLHLAMQRGRKIAKVAMARKLAVRLYSLATEKKPISAYEIADLFYGLVKFKQRGGHTSANSHDQ